MGKRSCMKYPVRLFYMSGSMFIYGYVKFLQQFMSGFNMDCVNTKWYEVEKIKEKHSEHHSLFTRCTHFGQCILIFQGMSCGNPNDIAHVCKVCMYARTIAWPSILNRYTYRTFSDVRLSVPLSRNNCPLSYALESGWSVCIR